MKVFVLIDLLDNRQIMGVFVNEEAAMELAVELEYKTTDYIVEPFLIVE